MADMDSIKKRIKKLEGKGKYPPRIVWEGGEDSVNLKTDQDLIVIGWGKAEPSNDRKQ
jgi:hypothetical protein